MSGIVATIKPDSSNIRVGDPVWVTFLIQNTTNHPVELRVPGVSETVKEHISGLPLDHVFSAQDLNAVVVTTEGGQNWDRPVKYRRPARTQELTIAPQASVGLRVDLREFFPILNSPGTYRLSWRPYGQAVTPGQCTIEIAYRKQVEIFTDLGKLTVQFYYEDAPRTVANFLELVKDGFYNNLTCHRLEPGYFVQCGDPRRDGTGIRRDGRRIDAEFNSRVHKRGTLSMALLNDDPGSASCQFFICNTRVPEWDGKYTLFGELVGDESYQTLDAIMASETDDIGRPLRTIYMRTVRAISMPEAGPR